MSQHCHCSMSVHCCREPYLVAFVSLAFLVAASLLPVLPSADVMLPAAPQKLVLPACNNPQTCQTCQNGD